MALFCTLFALFVADAMVAFRPTGLIPFGRTFGDDLEMGRMNDLANAIQAARGDRTIEQFASAAGCSWKTVWRWERGESRPRSQSHIRYLARQGVPRTLLMNEQPPVAAAVAV